MSKNGIGIFVDEKTKTTLRCLYVNQVAAVL